jgi:hypothetical protein
VDSFYSNNVIVANTLQVMADDIIGSNGQSLIDIGGNTGGVYSNLTVSNELVVGQGSTGTTILNGAISLNGPITGNSYITTLDVNTTRDVNVGGNLTVVGTTNLLSSNAASPAVSINGNLTVNGTITLNGTSNILPAYVELWYLTTSGVVQQLILPECSNVTFAGQVPCKATHVVNSSSYIPFASSIGYTIPARTQLTYTTISGVATGTFSNDLTNNSVFIADSNFSLGWSSSSTDNTNSAVYTISRF